MKTKFWILVASGLLLALLFAWHIADVLINYPVTPYKWDYVAISVALCVALIYWLSAVFDSLSGLWIVYCSYRSRDNYRLFSPPEKSLEMYQKKRRRH